MEKFFIINGYHSDNKYAKFSTIGDLNKSFSFRNCLVTSDEKEKFFFFFLIYSLPKANIVYIYIHLSYSNVLFIYDGSFARLSLLFILFKSLVNTPNCWEDEIMVLGYSLWQLKALKILQIGTDITQWIGLRYWAPSLDSII